MRLDSSRSLCWSILHNENAPRCESPPFDVIQVMASKEEDAFCRLAAHLLDDEFGVRVAHFSVASDGKDSLTSLPNSGLLFVTLIVGAARVRRNGGRCRRRIRARVRKWNRLIDINILMTTAWPSMVTLFELSLWQQRNLFSL